MPTDHARYMVTDTGPTRHTLDVPQRHWPTTKRSRALVELARIGDEELERSDAAQARAHSEAVNALTAFAGTFPPEYLEDLRDEWPS
ncbi:MAG: hypothetical protein LBK95_01530 [Bifidobacteriaceae bacterium]|nr:hypothetical protein [Bifidobacteriaceae bacterium]